MAPRSVTLDIEETILIQKQLLMGLAAFAEIDRARSKLDFTRSHPDLVRLKAVVDEVPKDHFSAAPSADDYEVENFVTALQSVTFALETALLQAGEVTA